MNRRRPGLHRAPARRIWSPDTPPPPQGGLAQPASVDAESRTKDPARSGRPQRHARWSGSGKPLADTRPGCSWERTARDTSVSIPPMRLDLGNRVANRDDDVLPNAIRGPRLVKSGGQNRASARGGAHPPGNRRVSGEEVPKTLTRPAKAAAVQTSHRAEPGLPAREERWSGRSGSDSGRMEWSSLRSSGNGAWRLKRERKRQEGKGGRDAVRLRTSGQLRREKREGKCVAAGLGSPSGRPRKLREPHGRRHRETSMRAVS